MPYQPKFKIVFNNFHPTAGSFVEQVMAATHNQRKKSLLDLYCTMFCNKITSYDCFFNRYLLGTSTGTLFIKQDCLSGKIDSERQMRSSTSRDLARISFDFEWRADEGLTFLNGADFSLLQENHFPIQITTIADIFLGKVRKD